jgi:hypothetical protein
MSKMTVKVLEDRTFQEGRFLTVELPDAAPVQADPPPVPAPEEARGSRAPELSAAPPAAAGEHAKVDDPQR